MTRVTDPVKKHKKLRKYYHRLDFQICIGLIIILATMFSFTSLYVTVINAMKSNDEIITNIFAFPNIATMWQNIGENFSAAWDKISGTMFSTIILALIGASGNCIIGAIIAYIFTFKEFPFKEALFTTFISVMLIPAIMGMPVLVPFVKNTLGLGDTWIGYLLPNWAGGQVSALFLFRTFFSQHSKSILESAQIEGANDFHILVKITIPMALPIILFHFVGLFSTYYNEYTWASLVFDKNMTLMPQMQSFQEQFASNQKGAMYAMYIISSVPLVISSMISMKYFKGGEFASGMKM